VYSVYQNQKKQRIQTVCYKIFEIYLLRLFFVTKYFHSFQFCLRKATSILT